MPTEATFLLAGLFIIAGAAGWAFARYSDRDREQQPSARISADYIRGLNLVLDRRTDEALELFVQIAKVDDETLETHFALGHLFRRRGEVDRAIRVHQNLLARPNLSESQRHQALFSLAEDYLSAGLFDRAEKLFGDLSGSSSMGKAALEKLVRIYEREREWASAIEAHRQLEVLTGEKSSHIAHYYCELAEQARVSGDLDLARKYLKNSVRPEAGALRGTLIRAAIAKEEEDYAQARRLYEQVVQADRRLIPDVLPELIDCYRVTGRQDELERYLEKLIAREGTIKNDLAYAAILGNVRDVRVLSECVQEFILHNDMLTSLIDTEALSVAEGERKEQAVQRIAGGLRQLAMSSARYRCTNCGYSTRRFIWHCPSCKQWESVRPIQSFEFEPLVS
jgi:lipopolysaccharide biosynthesis regulator YciM